MRVGPSLIALAAVLASGCASLDYPKDWSPPAQPTAGCASIDGTYRNRPSSAVPVGAPDIELRSLLDPGAIGPSLWAAPPRSGIQTVTLAHGDGVLTIIERGEGGTAIVRLNVLDKGSSPESGAWVHNWTWGAKSPTDTILCTRGAWYRTGEEVVVGNPFWDAATEVSGWNFQKAEDGSLVVRLHHGTLSLVPVVPIPIPISTEKWSWYRYDKVE